MTVPDPDPTTGDQTLYILRHQPWRETLELGRSGVEAYALDIPTPEDIDSDEPLRVFVPVPTAGVDPDGDDLLAEARGRATEMRRSGLEGAADLVDGLAAALRAARTERDAARAALDEIMREARLIRPGRTDDEVLILVAHIAAKALLGGTDG
jgi:hypothetical protein